MNLPELLQRFLASDDASFEVPANWHQGRTAFGGFSAVMALASARQVADDLPPLRSAQFAFVAPIAGQVAAEAQVLRRGRNAGFVEVRLRGSEGVGLCATLLFAQDRDFALDYQQLPAPDTLEPEATAPRPHKPQATLFTGHMDYRPALREKVAGRPEVARWVRLREREGLDAASEILSIGDALPPPGLMLLDEPKPASSFNWSINILEAHPQTRDGWWLVSSQTSSMLRGICSQQMTVWNRDGKPVAQSIQSVGIFG